MTKPAKKQTFNVSDAGSWQRVNRYDCCTEYFIAFNVSREGGGTYKVTVRYTPDMGTPQHESCDCPAYKFGGGKGCKHIDAVFESGAYNLAVNGPDESAD